MKKHIIIKGRVQGVGYRYWLYKTAMQGNIYGWVKNNTFGEVEALLVGNETDVNNLIKLCKKGPREAEVANVNLKNYEKEYLKKSFNIINNDN